MKIKALLTLFVSQAKQKKIEMEIESKGIISVVTNIGEGVYAIFPKPVYSRRCWQSHKLKKCRADGLCLHLTEEIEKGDFNIMTLITRGTAKQRQ